MAGEEITDEMLENLENVNGALDEFIDSLRASIKSTETNTKTADKQYKTTTKSNNEFDKLNATVRGTTEEQEEYKKVVEASVGVWNNMSSAAGRAAELFTGMTKDLMSDEGFGMFRSFIDPIADVMETLGSVAGDLVGNFIKLGKDAPFLGGAIETMGEMASDAGEALGKVAATAFKFVAEIALDSTEQLWNMFDGVASSGFLVANGMAEMKAQMTSLKLTTTEYTEVIKNQAENLSIFGGSVAEGAKKLAAVAKESEMHEQQLRRLGITYQEQAEMTSEFMESLARTGHLRAMSDQQIADASFEYMQNLTVVTALTGQQADDMKKNRQELMRNTAVQQKLSEMDQKTREEVQNVMGIFGPELQQGANEILLFGQVMSDVSLMTSGAAPIFERFINSVTNGEASFDEAFALFREELKVAGPEVLEQIGSLGETGMAQILGRGNAMTQQLQEGHHGLRKLITNVMNSTDEMYDNTKKASSEADDGVKNIVNMLDTQRRLMQRILDEAHARLPATSKALNSMVNGAESIIDMLGDAAGPDGVLTDTYDSITGTMNSIGTVIDTVKTSVVEAMDLGKQAFEDISNMIEEITQSSAYKMFFGVDDEEERIQTEKTRVNTLAAMDDFSVENRAAVQEDMIGASVEQKLKTEQALGALAASRRGDIELAELREELAVLRSRMANSDNDPETFGERVSYGFDTREEQEKELMEAIKELVRLQGESNDKAERLRREMQRQGD